MVMPRRSQNSFGAKFIELLRKSLEPAIKLMFTMLGSTYSTYQSVLSCFVPWPLLKASLAEISGQVGIKALLRVSLL